MHETPDLIFTGALLGVLFVIGVGLHCADYFVRDDKTIRDALRDIPKLMRGEI